MSPEKLSFVSPPPRALFAKRKVSYKARVEEALAEMRACIEHGRCSEQAAERGNNNSDNQMKEEENDAPKKPKVSYQQLHGKYLTQTSDNTVANDTDSNAECHMD